jgi:hypothetical protein
MASRTETPRKQFSGNFLFVNTSAGQLSTARHRKAIDVHVQSQYHRWRRQQNARNLRESANLPIRARRDAQRSSTLSDDPATANEPLLKSEVGEPVGATYDEMVRSLIPGPVTPLMKGNSDPFQTTPVAVTPDISRIMSYSSTWLIPTFLAPEKPVSESYRISSANNAMMFAFTDECHGYSAVAIVAMILATSTNDNAHMRLALNFRNRASKAVRARLEGSGGQPEFRTLIGIQNLFGLEAAVRNVTAAMSHINMLRFLLSRPNLDQSLALRIRESSLWMDMHFSCIYLTKPLLNVREWAPGSLDVSWTDLLAEPYDKGSESLPHFVHPSVFGHKLREIFSGFTELLDIDALLTRRPELGTSDVFRWMHLRKVECEAQLIHHYYDLDACGFNTLLPAPTRFYEPRHILQLKCICVAALSWSGLVFGKRQIAQGNRQLPDHLQKALLACHKDDSGYDMDPQLLLWVLYVGSMLEELAPNASNRVQWYTKQLAVQVNKIPLKSWDDIRSVLKQFLYSESLLPDHSRWCDEKVFSKSRTPSLENILSPLP